MPDHDHRGALHLREGTAEFDTFIVRAELDRGDNLAHCASHLAELLAFAPDDPDALALLARFLDAAGADPEALIPREGKLYYATEALRAYLWQARGRLADAVTLLRDVVHAKPSADYLDAWALPWLTAPGAIEALPDDVATALLGSVLNRFPDPSRATATQLRRMRAWAVVVERCAAKWPEGGLTTMLRAGFLRKAGRFAEAIAVATPTAAAPASWHAAIALGLVLREQGACADAERAFERALELDPDDVAARLEAGDMYCDRQAWEPALRWYERALAADDDHAWAKPSALYCRGRLGAEAAFAELRALSRGGNRRALQLCRREWGGLPEPHDASTNVLRQIAKSGTSGTMTMAVTSLEAPSNYLAFRLEMARLGIDARLDVSVNRVPEPDPRVPIGEVAYVLWTYDGTDPSPALPPPPAEITRAIGELAARRFADDLGWAAASHVAAELGPARVGEVLATMVHPPPIPDGFTALSWLPRVHHAAAQVIAQVEAGWAGTARRAALYALLHGPRDWTTDAAIRAIARIGRDHPAWFVDIHAAFGVLADHRPDAGYWSWERLLHDEWASLPLLFPDEKKQIEAKLAELDRADDT